MDRSTLPGQHSATTSSLTAGSWPLIRIRCAPNGVFMDTPNGYLGGIWHSGSGLAVDSAGNLYLATGNGLFDVNVGGIDYGDSILRLSSSGNQLAVQDYFTPWDQGWLGSHDWDVGSGGVHASA